MAWKQISATLIVAAMLSVSTLLIAQQPPAQAGGAQDHVAALKQSMQQGMGLARKYEWIETTTIILKGEEKGKKQSRCYYGADGKVQKIPIDQPAQAQDQGGRAPRRAHEGEGHREQER